jgi:hypothetical protein
LEQSKALFHAKHHGKMIVSNYFVVKDLSHDKTGLILADVSLIIWLISKIYLEFISLFVLFLPLNSSNVLDYDIAILQNIQMYASLIYTSSLDIGPSLDTLP